VLFFRRGNPSSYITPIIPAILLLLFAGCADSGPGISVDTVIEDGDNYLRFETNDSSFCQSMYYFLEEEAVAYPVERVEVSITKESGYASADFGLIFGYLDSDNHFLFSIDINGNYSVKRKESGIYTDLIVELLSGRSRAKRREKPRFRRVRGFACTERAIRKAFRANPSGETERRNGSA
jgi:hypothetical protein